MIHRYGFYKNFRSLKLYRNPDPSKSRWNRLVIPTNEVVLPSWEKKTSKHAGSPFRSWGYAGSFDGVDDYVEVPDSESLDVVGEFALEVVFKGKISKDHWILIDKGITSGNSWYFYCDHPGLMNDFVVFLNGSRYDHTLGDILADDTWYHMVWTVSGEGIKGYVNGELKGTWSEPTQVGANDYPLYLGRFGKEEPTYFNGIIALVRIYNRALSGDEVQALYNDPQNPPLDGLVLWLDKDTWDWESGKWRDKSGRGNHGTIHGVSKALPPLEAKFYEPKVVG